MTFQSRASHSNPHSLPRFCSREGATSICADAVWRGHPCEGAAREKLRSSAVALPGSSVVGSCGKYATQGRSRERGEVHLTMPSVTLVCILSQLGHG